MAQQKILPSVARVRPTGYNYLRPSLVLNNKRVFPAFMYLGSRATAAGWPEMYGRSTLTYADSSASTAATFNSAAPCAYVFNDSLLVNSGKAFEGGTGVYDLGTQDLIIEIIFKSAAGTNLFIVNKENVAGVLGWAVFLNNKVLGLRLRTTGPTDTITSSAALADGWHHAVISVNRDEASASGSRWIVDGVFSGNGTDHSGNAATMTNTGKFAIGMRSNNTLPYNNNIAYVAAWYAADWLAAGSGGLDEVQRKATHRNKRVCLR